MCYRDKGEQDCRDQGRSCHREPPSGTRILWNNIAKTTDGA
jgi:hypothetical protein